MCVTMVQTLYQDSWEVNNIFLHACLQMLARKTNLLDLSKLNFKSQRQLSSLAQNVGAAVTAFIICASCLISADAEQIENCTLTNITLTLSIAKLVL